MPGDAALRLLISINANPASALRAFASLATGAGGLSTVLLAVGVAAAAAAIAIGVTAVKAAADFQQGLNRLVTGAGDVTDNMKAMGQAILGISTDTGVLTGPLLAAMYQILSAGQRGAQALNTLAVSARGAVIEQANIVDVARAVSTAMTDMGLTATQAMNGYIQAVKGGKLSLEQLSVAMSPLLPIAANLGIKFNDVAAAMSVMTNAGLPADRAATSLRFLFQSLENPTAKANKAMLKLGLDSIAVGNELKKSLPGALEMIYKAALRAGPEGSVPFNRAVADMIGGQRSLQSFLSLTGSHFKTYVADSKGVADAMDKSKTSVQGWNTVQSNFNQVVARANAAWHAFLIVLGTELIPIVLKVWDGFNNLVKIGGQVIAFFQHNQLASDALKAVIIGLAVALGIAAAIAIPAIVTAFIAWAIAAGAAAIATLAAIWPFVLIGIVVALVVFGIIEAVRHWAAITKWFHDLWITIWTAVSTFFTNLWHGIEKAVLSGLATILGALQYLPGPLGIMAKSALKIVDTLMAGLDASTKTGAQHVSQNMQMMRQQSEHQMQLLHDHLIGHSIIPEMIAQIGAAFLKMAFDAISWGAALGNNFLAGLQKAWQAVVSWVNGALAWLKAHFPASPVKMGPLVGSENWGYNFAMNLADGMRRGMPAVQSAANMLAASMGGYSGSSSMSYSGGYPTGGGGSVIVIHNYLPSIKLDGAEVTDKIMRRVAKETRVQGTVRNR